MGGMEGGSLEEGSLEGEPGAHTLQRLEEAVPVPRFPTGQGALQGANQAGGSSSEGASSSLRGDKASSRQGEVVSSHPGGGIPTLLGDGPSHQDDHPSLVVGAPWVPSRVARDLLNPIPDEAAGPILQVEVDPIHLVEVVLLGPTPLVALVAIPLEADGPTLQVEVAPIRRVGGGPLDAGAPSHLEEGGPIQGGPCRRVGRLLLAVPSRVDSVWVPSCSDQTTADQTINRLNV